MPRPYVSIHPGIIRTTTVTWKIDPREVSTGTFLNGRPGTGGGARFPRWTGEPALVLHGDRIPRFRAALATGRGMLGVYRILMFDPVGGHAPLAAALGWSGGIPFDDGTGFENVPVAPCVGGAAAGATEFVIDEADAPAPVRIGQIISHYGPMPASVSSLPGDLPVLVVGREDLGGGEVRLRVEPPLRAAIGDGDPVALIGSGWFESADTLSAWPDYDLNRVARPTWRLVEHLR
jgi:hypothetical protein